MSMFTRLKLALIGAGVAFGGAARAQKPPLLPEKDVAALANELSGETAKRNLEGIARFHRQRGSRGFHSAAELVAERAQAYGLSDVVILQFPADGKIFYGTQRSRPAWDAEAGELWEVKEGKEVNEVKEKSVDRSRPDGVGAKEWRATSSEEKIASYQAQPVVLAEDSESADVAAELVDVGEGLKESDYAGKDVKGKIILVSAQPGAVQDLAVGKFGAAGIVSYAQNQQTAWRSEDENLIRWGHLETFSEHKTFGFMVSLKAAGAMRDRLAKREKYSAYTMGSDHDVYQDSSFGIPTIYLNDWPDRYIHTNFDTAANIDTTKLKRAAFIGAASGYFLAEISAKGSATALQYVEAFGLQRGTEIALRSKQVSDAEAQNLTRQYVDEEIGIANSIKQMVPSSISVSEIRFNGAVPLKLSEGYKKPSASTKGEASAKFIRRSQPKGPLAVFGYDYFVEHAKAAGVGTPKLLSYEGLWGAAEEYGYEVLNFADGKRNVEEIRDAVSAEYGPVPLELVMEYLKALEKIGAVELVK